MNMGKIWQYLVQVHYDFLEWIDPSPEKPERMDYIEWQWSRDIKYLKRYVRIANNYRLEYDENKLAQLINHSPPKDQKLLRRVGKAFDKLQGEQRMVNDILQERTK